MKLTFDVIPIPKARARVTTRGGFARAYTPSKTRSFERELQILAKEQWKQPALTGALSVAINFFLPVKDKKLWGKPHDKRPDADNLCKGVLDSVNEILWEDDGQIYHIDIEKRYAEKGRIELFIYKYEKEKN